MMQEQVLQQVLEKKPENTGDKLISAYGRYIMDNPVPANAYHKLSTALDSYKAAHPGQVATASRLKRWLVVHAYVVFIGTLILPEMFKPFITDTIGILFSPLVATLPFLYIVLLLTGAVAATGMLLQKYIIDWDFSRMIAARNKALRAEMNAARKANDQERIKAVQERQLACVDDSSKMMKQTLSSLAYLLLFSFPVFMWLFWFFTDNQHYSIIYPFLGRIGVNDMFLVIPGWIIWSMVCSASASQVFRFLFNVGRHPE